jgi:hypothetical protein
LRPPSKILPALDIFFISSHRVVAITPAFMPSEPVEFIFRFRHTFCYSFLSRLGRRGVIEDKHAPLQRRRKDTSRYLSKKEPPMTDDDNSLRHIEIAIGVRETREREVAGSDSLSQRKQAHGEAQQNYTIDRDTIQKGCWYQ